MNLVANTLVTISWALLGLPLSRGAACDAVSSTHHSS